MSQPVNIFEFHKEHISAIESLVNAMNECGLSETDLDELVHTAAEECGDDTEYATSINNYGMQQQITYIMIHNGELNTQKLIEGVIADNTASWISK